MEKRTYYLARKLSCGDVLDYAAEFLRIHLKDLIVMTLFFHLPVMLVTHYLSGSSMLLRALTVEFNEYQFEEASFITLRYLLMFYAGLMLSSVYSLTLYQGFHLGVIKYTYEELVHEERLRPKKALGFGLRKFGWMLVFEVLLGAALYAVVFLFYILILLGIVLFALLVPEPSGGMVAAVLIGFFLLLAAFVCLLLYFSVRLFFVPHAVVIEECNAFSAIKRSFALTKKRFWRTAFPMVFGVALLSFAQSAVQGLFSTMALTGNLAFRIAESVCGGLSAFLAPVTFLVGTVLFVHFKTQDGDVAFECSLREAQRALQAEGTEAQNRV